MVGLNLILMAPSYTREPSVLVWCCEIVQEVLFICLTNNISHAENRDALEAGLYVCMEGMSLVLMRSDLY